MRTLNDILDEINEEEDWHREDNGSIKERRVKLSRLLDDSFELNPHINIRSLNPKRIDNIKSKIVNNNGLITTALAMKYGDSFCIIDGNHKQMSLKKVCQEVSPERIKKFGFDKIKIQVLKGDPTNEKDAWRAYCISYKVNIDATTVEKILAIGYGWEHYGKGPKYLSNLVVEFDEKREVLKRHKQGYVLLMELKELNSEDYEVFMEKYKHERCSINAVIEKLRELIDANKKANGIVNEPKKDGDALIGSVVNSVKKAEVIIDELLVNDSGYYIHEAKLDNIIGFLKKAKEQIHDEGGTHDIHILNNNHYSNLKSSEEKLKEGMEKKSEVIIKLIEIRKLVHGIMMEAKRGNNH